MSSIFKKIGIEMTIEEVYDFYKNITKAAAAIDVTRETFYGWIKKGAIPFKHQLKYQLISKRKLKANPTHVKEKIVAHANIPLFRFYDNKFGMCEVISLYNFNNKELRIGYSPVNKKIKLFSLKTANLMQATNFKDSMGRILYEKDIIESKGKKFEINSIFDCFKLTSITVKDFLIVGNQFEGAKDGH